MERRLVSFDWAIKHLLRDSANFDVLEGLLTVLLKEPIEILDIIESERNRDRSEAKLTRIDLRARSRDGKIILIELQYQTEVEYLYRMHYYAASTIVEHLNRGQKYVKTPKVISINILHFSIGSGEDYIYVGRTRFRGLHGGDLLTLSQREREELQIEEVSEIFTDYYLVLLNRFRKERAEDRLDEWVWMLKTGRVEDGFTAPGLDAARLKLDEMELSGEERDVYRQWQIDEMRESGIVRTAEERGKQVGILQGRVEGEQVGIEKGEQIGIEKGEQVGIEKGERIGIEKGERIGIEKGERIGVAKGRIEVAINMIRSGIDDALIAEITGLSAAKIERLRRSHDGD